MMAPLKTIILNSVPVLFSVFCSTNSWEQKKYLSSKPHLIVKICFFIVNINKIAFFRQVFFKKSYVISDLQRENETLQEVEFQKP